MSERTDNPAGRLPDERAMLAFVEGDLSVAEEVLFRRGLRGAPRVLVRLEAMRRDKALLRATMLRESLVPGPLAARVEEAMGREALIAAAYGESRSDGVSAVPEIRTRVIGRRWSAGGVGVGLALAAGVALAFGGLMLVIGRGGQPSVGPTIASGGGEASRARGVMDREGVPGEGELAAAPELDRAAGEVSIASADSSEVGDPGDGDRVDGSPDESPLRVAATPSALDPFPEPVDGPDELVSTRLLPGAVARKDLMALAEQHRLALRVSAQEPREVIAALEAAVGGTEDVPWRTVGDSPRTLAGSLGVTIQPFDERAFAGSPGAREGGAGRGPGESPGRGGSRSDDSWLLRPTADALAVYLAEVEMSPEGLARLDRDLSSRGQSRSGFAALADPLDRVLGDMGLLVPADDVIWWYHPPREWSRRTLVPVVVERR